MSGTRCPFCQQPVEVALDPDGRGVCPCGARYEAISREDLAGDEPWPEAWPEPGSRAGPQQPRVTQLEADGTVYELVFY